VQFADFEYSLHEGGEGWFIEVTMIRKALNFISSRSVADAEGGVGWTGSITQYPKLLPNVTEDDASL